LTHALWRIAVEAPAYSAQDLSGKGAELSAGRWNAKGTPMVYAATNVSLAVLETIVHFNAASLPLNRFLVRIDVPADLWRQAIALEPAAHVGWDAVPAGKASIDWGTAWSAGGASALAFVPSVVAPEELNCLINPRHGDTARLKATKLRKWIYDTRLKR